MFNETINVDFGKEIVIELRSNPTTGYRWCVLSSEGLNVEEDYIPDRSERGMCGVGGIQQLRISTANPGTFTLKVSYKREWEDDEGDIREYTLTFE